MMKLRFHGLGNTPNYSGGPLPAGVVCQRGKTYQFRDEATVERLLRDQGVRDGVDSSDNLEDRSRGGEARCKIGFEPACAVSKKLHRAMLKAERAVVELSPMVSEVLEEV